MCEYLPSRIQSIPPHFTYPKKNGTIVGFAYFLPFAFSFPIQCLQYFLCAYSIMYSTTFNVFVIFYSLTGMRLPRDFVRSKLITNVTVTLLINLPYSARMPVECTEKGVRQVKCVNGQMCAHWTTGQNPFVEWILNLWNLIRHSRRPYSCTSEQKVWSYSATSASGVSRWFRIERTT